MNRKLTELQRRAPSVLLSLRDPNPSVGQFAAAQLMREAKDFGLSLSQFLTIAIDPRLEKEADKKARFAIGDNEFLGGLDCAMLALDLPHRDNFSEGVLLQAAADTFQTFPGTRAMFPEVIDSMLRWKNRQINIENIGALISQSRTINGPEMISTAVLDDSGERDTFTIAEGSEIPVRTIRTSQQSVGIFKHGSGIRTTYEFERRASLDIMTPFAARIARELEASKVRAATAVLINGDGVNPAATVESFSAYGGTAVNGTTSKLRTQYESVANWLVTRAAKGTPVDTIVGNLKAYLELLFMFNPTLPGNGTSTAAAMAAQGAPSINVSLPILNSNVNFALSSAMPNDKILGFTKGETLEELVEAGSSIAENEKAITNQTITYVRTENSGFRLAFGDTRYLLDLAA